MALCFVHGAAGYLAYEVVRRNGPPRPVLLAAAVALANAPDLDFLPGLLVGQPALYHRGVTHTLGAVVVIGIVVGLAFRIFGRRHGTATRAALWVAAVYASHLVIDFFTTNVQPPRGARLLWPLSGEYLISPVTPLGEIVIDPAGRLAFLQSLVQSPALRVWLGEIGLLMLVVAAVRLVRLARTGLDAAAAEVPEEP